MKSEEIKVRRRQGRSAGYWVVDIKGMSNGYVTPDGTTSYSIIDYGTKETAEAAKALYLKKQRITSAGETKDTNPKESLGIKKVPTHCIPTGPLLELGLAMMEGGRKYGTHNYRAMGAKHSVYHDGIIRHLKAWWEGEDTDQDSGLHHLIKIMGCCVVMRDSILMGNDIDDRPIRYPNGLNMKLYNQLAEDIIKKYSVCKEPFTQIRKDDECGKTT